MNGRFQISDLLLRLLEDHGAAPRAVAVRAGLAREFFEQERVSVTTRERFAVSRAVGELSGDPAIGLKIGAEPRLERYDAVAIAAVCTRSFRHALERMARFEQLLCPEELRVVTHGDEASVELAFLEATEDEPEVLVDLCFARVFAIGRRGIDKLNNALRVELKRPSRERDLLEAHFGRRVRFGSAQRAGLPPDGPRPAVPRPSAIESFPSRSPNTTTTRTRRSSASTRADLLRQPIRPTPRDDRVRGEGSPGPSFSSASGACQCE